MVEEQKIQIKQPYDHAHRAYAELMASRHVPPDGTKSTMAGWRTRIIGGVLILAVLIVTYFLLAAFVPRWWAQQITSSVHGSFSKGILWGLFYGGLLTAISLLLLLLAATAWKRRAGKFIAGATVMVAVLLTVPNLMTLSVVLGGNNAAHAGQRIMDVNAPAFRGACLVGAIIAVVPVLFVIRRRTQRHWKRRRAVRAVANPVPPPARPQPPPAPETTTRPSDR